MNVSEPTFPQTRLDIAEDGLRASSSPSMSGACARITFLLSYLGVQLTVDRALVLGWRQAF